MIMTLLVSGRGIPFLYCKFKPLPVGGFFAEDLHLLIFLSQVESAKGLNKHPLLLKVGVA